MSKINLVLLLGLMLLEPFTFSSKTQQKTLLEASDHLRPEDRICFAMYTVHEKTLKLTAQFYPISNYDPFEAYLQIQEAGEWVTKDTTDIIYPGYTAPFRIENWDDTQVAKYRVAYNNRAFYEGTIQRNPREKDEIIMAAFTCNSVYPEHGGDISRQDIVENMKRIKPDLLFFSGDQVYAHSEHYQYWLKFGRDFGEIIRNTPTICLPDDHDIGQGNLWGAGGIKATSRDGTSGGYYMPAEYVKEVERAQTSHLPDPYDPTPVARDIGVYYTDLKWGGISFAILEDRKFKSGLEGLVIKEGKYVSNLDNNFDQRPFNVKGATLLGDRQLKFLEEWTTDWQDVEMKTVLSQTIFAMSSTHSGKYDKPIGRDFDSNGWPQRGRDKALATIRKSFSCMIAGDQHLGTLIHHGIDDWGDAGYSFCTPAIANFWLRWWEPKEEGKNRSKKGATNTGQFFDGFENKITMHAVANPTIPKSEDGGKLTTRAAGFGLVRYKKASRLITFECWPRNVDISDPSSKQYEGWPVTISQKDNYPISNGFELPKFKFQSEGDQVVTVINEEEEVVSSIRVKGYQYQPITLAEGTYKVQIGEDDKKEFSVKASKTNRKVIRVQ